MSDHSHIKTFSLYYTHCTYSIMLIDKVTTLWRQQRDTGYAGYFILLCFLATKLTIINGHTITALEKCKLFPSAVLSTMACLSYHISPQQNNNGSWNGILEQDTKALYALMVDDIMTNCKQVPCIMFLVQRSQVIKEVSDTQKSC